MRKNGFLLVVALFLLVILGAAATWILQLTNHGQRQVDTYFQSTKASYAAFSALQWGAYQIKKNNQTNQPICFTGTATMNFTQGGLKDYQASITCTANGNVYTLTALGFTKTPGDAYYAASEKTLIITFSP